MAERKRIEDMLVAELRDECRQHRRVVELAHKLKFAMDAYNKAASEDLDEARMEAFGALMNTISPGLVKRREPV